LTELMVSDSPIRKQSRIRSCDFFYTLLVVVVAVVIIYSSTRFIFLVNWTIDIDIWDEIRLGNISNDDHIYIDFIVICLVLWC